MLHRLSEAYFPQYEYRLCLEGTTNIQNIWKYEVEVQIRRSHEHGFSEQQSKGECLREIPKYELKVRRSSLEI